MLYTVNESNLEYVTHLLPEQLEPLVKNGEAAAMFSTSRSDEPVSLLVAKQYEQRVEILWIYTDEEHRGRGHAAALLARLEYLVTRMGTVESITAALSADAPEREFFLAAGYVLEADEIVEYSFAASELSHIPFWNAELDIAGVVPLHEIPNYAFGAYELAVRNQGNSAELPLPLKTADCIQKLSFGYMSANKLQGVLLFEEADDGGLYLSGVHTLTGAAAQLLFYAAGREVIKSYPPETAIHVIAVNEVANRLVDKLIDNAKKRYICRFTRPIKNIGRTKA